MILKIGSQALDQNEVNMRRVQRTGIIGPYGRFVGYRHVWQVEGIVRASSQSNLKTAVDNRKTYFNSKDYNRDVSFYFNDGTTITSDTLPASGSANGVICRGIEFGPVTLPQMTEWVAYRSYRATFEAEYADNSQSTVISYVENVELIGDGSSDYAVLECLTATPQAQVTKLYTKMAARQWGAAVGLLDYPSYPSPLGVPKPHGTRFYKGSPLSRGRLVNRNFPIRWSYFMESPAAFTPYVIP